MELANKRILLTGATGGVGRLVAHLLAKKGAVLALVGRDMTKINRPAVQYPSRWWQSGLHRSRLKQRRRCARSSNICVAAVRVALIF